LLGVGVLLTDIEGVGEGVTEGLGVFEGVTLGVMEDVGVEEDVGVGVAATATLKEGEFPV
jgi:hypothetical protein